MSTLRCQELIYMPGTDLQEFDGPEPHGNTALFNLVHPSTSPFNLVYLQTEQRAADWTRKEREKSVEEIRHHSVVENFKRLASET